MPYNDMMFTSASKAAFVPRDNTAFALANCPASAAAVAASSGGVRLTARATLKNRSSVSFPVESAAPPLSSTKKPPARSTPPTDSNQLKGGGIESDDSDSISSLAFAMYSLRICSFCFCLDCDLSSCQKEEKEKKCVVLCSPVLPPRPTMCKEFVPGPAGPAVLSPKFPWRLVATHKKSLPPAVTARGGPGDTTPPPAPKKSVYDDFLLLSDPPATKKEIIPCSAASNLELLAQESSQVIEEKDTLFYYYSDSDDDDDEPASCPDCDSVSVHSVDSNPPFPNLVAEATCFNFFSPHTTVFPDPFNDDDGNGNFYMSDCDSEEGDDDCDDSAPPLQGTSSSQSSSGSPAIPRRSIYDEFLPSPTSPDGPALAEYERESYEYEFPWRRSALAVGTEKNKDSSLISNPIKSNPSSNLIAETCFNSFSHTTGIFPDAAQEQVVPRYGLEFFHDAELGLVRRRSIRIKGKLPVTYMY